MEDTKRTVPDDIEATTSLIRDALDGRNRFLVPKESLGELKIRDAAVLIPILNRADGPTVLFVQRTDKVPTHKNQIAFPGGALEDGEDFDTAALREAEEEVALVPSTVEVLGQLDDLLTITSFIVRPVVGIVREPPDIFDTIQEFEVEKAFETPLAHLLDPGNFRIERFEWKNVPSDEPLIQALKNVRWPELGWDPTEKDYPMFFFDTPDGVVWGATAVMLKQFLSTVFGF